MRLFETETHGGRAAYRLHAVTVAAGILLVLYYRATHVPAAGEGRAAWLGMLVAELWYAAYWAVMQSVRWSPLRRRPLRDRLSAKSVRRPAAVCSGCVTTKKVRLFPKFQILYAYIFDIDRLLKAKLVLRW